MKRSVAEKDNPASSSCGGNGKRHMSSKGAKGNANGMVSSCVGHKVPKKVPPGTKTYSIVGSVSSPTYKKYYAGAIFEFSENNGMS